MKSLLRFAWGSYRGLIVIPNAKQLRTLQYFFAKLLGNEVAICAPKMSGFQNFLQDDLAVVGN